jgi:hypothetical protein
MFLHVKSVHLNASETVFFEKSDMIKVNAFKLVFTSKIFSSLIFGVYTGEKNVHVLITYLLEWHRGAP